MTEIPSTLGRFRIDGNLGAASAGTSYSAHDLDLGRQVVLLVVPKRITGNPARLQKLKDQAGILALIDHPGIRTLHGIGEDAGRVYLILEDLAGETLADRLQRGALAPPEALAVARDVARALEAAHARSTIHENLTPHNVFLTQDGRVKVLGLEVPRGLLQRGTSERQPQLPPGERPAVVIPTRMRLTTRQYRAPEYSATNEPDPRSDIYSLGAILLECLTGLRPETLLGGDGEKRGFSIEMLAGLGGALPPTIGPLLGKCLRTEGQERPLEIAWVRRALETAADSASRPSRPVAVGNLSEQFTAFVGRDAECDAIQDTLTTEGAIALVGPGGVGKSRLALQVAGQLRDRFGGCAFLVPLAQVSTPDRLYEEISSALGLWGVAADSRPELLGDYLHDRRVLLILDSADQVLGEASRLATLFDLQPGGVQVIYTSRQAPASPVHTLIVAPLAVPRPEAVATVEEALRFDAVRLFVDRAAQARPGYRLVEEALPAVLAICWGLDGLPLALELAANRLRMLSIQQILSMMGERLGLLSKGMRSAPPHQRTLRAMIDWSYDQLSEAEQELLSSVSLFVGGCTLEAVGAVHDVEPEEGGSLSELMQNLEGKSLLCKEEHAKEVRYRMLQTVREYSLEKMRRAGDEDSLRGRQLNYYQAFATRAEEGFRGPDSDLWLERVTREFDTIRELLDWSEAQAPEAGAESRSTNPLSRVTRALRRPAGRPGAEP